MVAWFVYRKITDNENLREFSNLLRDFNGAEVFGIVAILLLLMGINWLLECKKWQFLCRPIQMISLGKAFTSVFSGLSWAVFTPNRIGEYGGRVFFLKPRKRLYGVVAMAVGSFAQMLITNVVGALASAWFVVTYLEVSLPVQMLAWGVALLISGGLLFVYTNIQWVVRFTQNISWLSKVHRFLLILNRYDRRSLWVVFRYSLGRYTIFTSQYCFLMQALIPDLPFVPMLMMIFILFFIQSALPSLDLIDVGVRSLTASYFFAFITTQELAVMASSASIWFTNLIVPAIIGAFFVFKINFFGNSHSE